MVQRRCHRLREGHHFLGAFDVVAVKPYGFDTGPDDRRVEPQRLNFSRAILVRELMLAQGDGGTAIWAGNWGWNSLPVGWAGRPSIWGQTTAEAQAAQTVAALERARREWPWMGLMFLENWTAAPAGTAADDPRWGFSIAGRPAAEALAGYQAGQLPSVAAPGFHLARSDDPAQVYSGAWAFSPQFGADIGQSGDRVTFTFWVLTSACACAGPTSALASTPRSTASRPTPCRAILVARRLFPPLATHPRTSSPTSGSPTAWRRASIRWS